MQKDQQDRTILGITIDSRDESSLLKLLRKRLTIRKPIFVVTPNPENILGASKTNYLQKIMNSADFAPVDGIGVAAASYYISLHTPKNKAVKIIISFVQGLYVGLLVLFRPSVITKAVPVIKGRQLFLSLVSLAQQKRWRVYLLGGEADEADLAAEKVRNLYPTLNVRSNSGPLLTSQAFPRSEKEQKLQNEVIKEIQEFKPQLLFVAFSFPKQEMWLAQNLPILPVGLGMTVGGTFNFVSGRSKVPPRLVPRSLEWLWRLVTEPWRMRRIVNATVVFPITVYKFKVSL